MDFFRPLPGVSGGSGSGPSYDDIELENRAFALESEVRGPHYAMDPAFTVTLTAPNPLPSGSDFPTLEDFGLVGRGVLILSIGGVEYRWQVSPTDGWEDLTPTDAAAVVDVSIVAPAPNLPWYAYIQPTGGDFVQFLDTPAARQLGLVEVSRSVVQTLQELPDFWRGGEQLRVPQDFPNIAAALHEASKRYPLPNAKIEVIVADGTVDTTDFQLPDANLAFVTVRPATLDNGVVMPSNIVRSGNIGAYDLTLTLPTGEAAKYSVGDICLVYMDVMSVNANNSNTVGGWKVISISGNTITVRNTSKLASLSPSSMWAKKMHVRVRRTTPLLVGNRSPVFRDIAFESTEQIRTINVVGQGVLSIHDDSIKPGVSIVGGAVGLTVDDAGEVHGTFACTSANTNGLQVNSGSVVTRGFICNGTDLYDGVVVNFGGKITMLAQASGLRPIACGNGGSGFVIRQNSDSGLTNISAQGNANNNSVIADGNSRIVVSGQKDITGNYSPSANTNGNSNSFIRVY